MICRKMNCKILLFTLLTILTTALGSAESSDLKENMAMSESKEERWGVFWYNEEAVNSWSDADFEAKASEFAANGVNRVMTFSFTHFRWSFYPWWDKINHTISRVVRACHKYNIKVIEHHSSHLTSNPRTAKDWQNWENSLKVRQSSANAFAGLKEYIAAGDPEIAPGVYLSDCRQIDGRTGDYARTIYGGYGHCFNNPHFRKAYFDYLAKVYAAGVDGIMTDDVHFFGYFNACSCKFCREKFRKESGYELPPPHEWGKFHGDYSNKVFIAWLQFRMRSTAEFQKAVNQHAESLGYKLLRPNYHTTTYNWNQTAYPFESTGELWTTVFQENMFSSVISQSWLSWAATAAHRRAMARRYKSRAMSMFYPDSYDKYYFSWALARSWNHLLMATPEGGDLNKVEKLFAGFSDRHPVSATPQEVPDVAFMQPRSSMDYTADGLESSARPLRVWMQSAVYSNLQTALLFENESPEEFARYPLLVVPGATMLSDNDLQTLYNYCQQGGRLLICGAFGIFNTDGTRREHPEKIFRFTADLSSLCPTGEGEFTFNDRKVKLDAVKESSFLSNLAGDYQVIARDKDNKVLGISAMNGNLIWLAGGVMSRSPEAEQYPPNLNRWAGKDNPALAQAQHYAADYLARVPGKILEAILPQKKVLHCSNPDYRATIYASADRNKYVVHLVNTGNTLARKGESYSHSDQFANFMPNAPRNAEVVELIINLPGGSINAETVQAFTPESAAPLTLKTQIRGGSLVVAIPQNSFSGYLMIKL